MPSDPPPLVLYRWFVVDEITGKRRLTSYLMTEADALERHPGAEPDPQTREVRSGTPCQGAGVVMSKGR